MNEIAITLDEASIVELVHDCFSKQDRCERAKCILSLAKLMEKAAVNTLSEHCPEELKEVD